MVILGIKLWLSLLNSLNTFPNKCALHFNTGYLSDWFYYSVLFLSALLSHPEFQQAAIFLWQSILAVHTCQLNCLLSELESYKTGLCYRVYVTLEISDPNSEKFSKFTTKNGIFSPSDVSQLPRKHIQIISLRK